MKKYQLPTLNDLKEFYESSPFADRLGLWEELEGHDYIFLCHQYALRENPTLPMSEVRELSDHLKSLLETEVMSQREVA